MNMKIKLKYLLLLMSFTAISIVAYSQIEEMDYDVSNALQEEFEANGIEKLRGLLDRLLESEKKFEVNEPAIIQLSGELFDSNMGPDAIFLLESAELFSSKPVPRIKRYLATLYYMEGQSDKSENAMREYNEFQADRQLNMFIDYAGKENIYTSAEEVIEKYISATGGLEAWKNIKSLKITFKVQPESGRRLKLVRYYKRPFLYRQEIEGSKSFNTTNGKTTWKCTEGEWSESSVNYRFASMDDYMIDYNKIGIDYELKGLEILENSPVYHLTRTFADGFSQELYFSAESGLLLETESDYTEDYPLMRSFFSAWDYRDAGGVLIPHTFIRNIGNMGPPHGLVVEKIDINPDLPDEMFLPPDLTSVKK